MKIFRKFYLLSLTLILLIACSKEEKLPEVEYRIPINERFLFLEGDTLLYNSSNGAADTVVVKDYLFETETGTYSSWGVDVHDFTTETQTIIIEALHDKWKYERIESQCLIIQSQPKYSDIYPLNFPFCQVNDGCEIGGSRGLADKLSDYEEIVLNNKTYMKVYHQFRGDYSNGFEIYWNLKYGLIKLTGFSDGIELTWDLKGKL